ncbi:MAG: hypothetical protein ACRC57_05645 [Sarcina sp.]
MSINHYYKGIENGIIAIQEALNSEYKIINIIVEPYKSKKIISKIAENNYEKKILYLSFRENYISDIISKNLVFDNFTKINEMYDYIILDDISFYSNYTKGAISSIIDHLYKFAKKILIFAIEEIIYKSLTLTITTQTKDTHIKEPRVIVTRFDLREKMPYILYTYLEWFYSKGENTIIYAEKNKAKGIYANLLNIEEEFENLEVILYEGSNVELQKTISNRKNSIIIHSNIQSIIDNIKNTNVIMYNDNKNFYPYKQIVFLCGRYSVLTEKKELILLSKKDSENIDKARKITRIFNEIPWRD